MSEIIHPAEDCSKNGLKPLQVETKIHTVSRSVETSKQDHGPYGLSVYSLNDPFPTT